HLLIGNLKKFRTIALDDKANKSSAAVDDLVAYDFRLDDFEKPLLLAGALSARGDFMLFGVDDAPRTTDLSVRLTHLLALQKTTDASSYREFAGQPDSIPALAIHQGESGRHALTGDRDGNVYYWTLETPGTKKAYRNLEKKHNGLVGCAA